MSLAPRIPLVRSTRDGYGMIDTYGELVAQNLKMLVLTNPGERIMDPNFGVGARRLLFENMTPVVFETFKSRLLQQVQRYMPYVQIANVDFTSPLNTPNVDENFLGITISYFNTATGRGSRLRIPALA